MAAMRTILIRIEDAPEQSPVWYPVKLYCDDASAPEAWFDQPRATAELPAEAVASSLSVTPAIAPDGGTSNDHERAIDAISQFLLSQRDPSGEFAKIGCYLHDLLIRDDIAAQWRTLTAASPGAPRPAVRLYLEVRPHLLRRLPWELLRVDNQIVFASASGACSRIVPKTDLGKSHPEEDWPMRVMVVVGSKPNDPDVDAERELAELEDALRPLDSVLDLDVVKRPSQPTLLKRFELVQPHVLHFIGHGGHDPMGEGCLKVYDAEDTRQTWDLTPDLVGMAFGDASPPRIVVLNACRSQSAKAHEAAWMLSDAFGALGVPAIVGMQGDIRGTAATYFTAGLYGCIS